MSVVDKTEYVSCEKKYNEECDPIFSSEEEMKRSLSKFCYGNLYTIGKIWIYSLRASLVGAKLCPFPKVHAWAEVKKDPEKPKPMRASELPIYDCPHVKYKDFLEDKYRCESKLMHNAVLPHVSGIRESCQNVVTSTRQELSNTYKEIAADIGAFQNNMKKHWRDDSRLTARRGCVAAGSLLGYHIGSKGGISRRLFYAACGAFATGMLCFPNETDKMVRDICYSTGKAAIRGFNYMSGRNLEIKEHLPCPKPKPPDEKYDIKCGCK